MFGFYDSGYVLARLIFERLLGLVYLIAFLSTLAQFRALCGERGLLPAPRYLRAAGFRRSPSLFHLHYSDRLADALAALGAVLSGAVVLGLTDVVPLPVAMAVWAALWVLYLSFVNAGQAFYGFVWEMLLLEAGFLAIFLGNADTAPPIAAVFLLRWLLVRLEVGAGLIKVRNDPAWRDLTALYYHHETQPIPNRFSWYFHHLPKPIHRLEVLGNHVAQLIVPFGLLCPQPIASVSAGIVIVTQLWLMVSGNFAWLNLLAVALATLALDGRFLAALVPIEPTPAPDGPLWFTITVTILTVAMVLLSWAPVRNMASRHQLMNATFNRLYLGNTYGLFGHITRTRLELVIEGTDDQPESDPTWKAYEFRAKPGILTRRPRQVAPYHLRLDWLMWFAAMSPPYAEAWLLSLVVKLLQGDPVTLRLLATNPFPEGPPKYLRILLYVYRFTTREERRSTGAWWTRGCVGDYLPPATLRATPDADRSVQAPGSAQPDISSRAAPPAGKAEHDARTRGRARRNRPPSGHTTAG
ncbi:lipase maturation factor family protein [Nocardia sp. NBC_00508]|uniref:lipase maturation factor family protein n=1 Tax=Nocardia sp. NBC_00508 TaxID=2975992 RepID=UPI002E8074CD|nr:lipase maturation factor family protein [Nocardia sp. NBC_00508]WUD64682.1 lipase maturation factor family protein [Nocardia sp. NBC_00508]